MTKLSKELSFIDIYLFSVGYIIGAGIFVLIGQVSKYSKNLTWLPFIIAGLFALIISTSYVDISTIYKTNHGDYMFVKDSIGEIPAIITILLLLGIGIFTNSTIAKSIGDFLSPIFSVSSTLISIILILLFSIINCIGIRETTNYNHICTIVEILALIVICFVGFFIHSPSKQHVLSNKVNIPDIMYASILALFVYSGFEGTVKLSEEAKDPNDIPLAIVSSVITTILIYVFVSIAVIKCCNTDKLDQYPIPIVKMASTLFGEKVSYLFYIIAILSITNTLLISILGTSRMLHSISGEYSALNMFTKVNKDTKTPIVATVAIALISILTLCFKNVETLASITSYLMFVVFIILNFCLIYVYQDKDIQSKLKGGWTYSINQGKPILPVLGLVLSVGILSFGLFRKH
jgi:basic amino acid/polyamine antiporter, APA family